MHQPMNVSKIITCQAVVRRWLACKNNIYIKLKHQQPRFTSVLKGYHMLNKTPIAGAVWEELNCDIVSDVCTISDEANGNHLSGKDNRFDNFNISNKTSKTDKNDIISISSYRLTSVCSDKSPGDEREIIQEIEKRDSSFEYYSILNCKRDGEKLLYEWYMIPKDYYLFKMKTLKHKIGQQGKKKGTIVGWSSDYCDILFSMSSQLWYKFMVKDIKKYRICSVEIDNSKPKLSYSQIYSLLGDTT